MGRVKSVRDGYDRATCEQTRDGPFEVAGRARVEQRRGLVENQRVRIREKKPRDCNLLCERRWQQDSRGSDARVEAIGKQAQGAVCVDGRQHGDQLVVTRSGRGEPEVVAKRACKEVMLLRHESDLATQPVRRQARGCHASHLDEPLARRVDSGEQEREGALSGTARADHCESGPGRRQKVDPVENVMTLAVRVMDVRCHEAIVGRHQVGHRCRRYLAHPDDARQRCRSELDLVLPGEQRVDRHH